MQNNAQRSGVTHRRVPSLDLTRTTALTTPFSFSRISKSRQQGRRKASGASAAALLMVVATIALLYRTLLYTSHSKNLLVMDAPPSFTMASNSSNNNTLTSCVDSHVDKGRVWLVGIVRNASADISLSRMQTIVDLNCQWNISVHVVAGVGVRECRQLYHQTLLLLPSQTLAHNNKNDCAPFHVEEEPAHISEMTNRVDRIAAARDYQRERLRVLYYNNDTATLQKDDLVVVVDLDLHSLPPLDVLLQQIHDMQRGSIGACRQPMPVPKQYDAVCAAGIMHRPYGYYDIFATVLLPDTFVYPIKGRLIREYAEMENPDLVRSDNLYGNFTQWDLLDFFETESRKLTKRRTADLKNNVVLNDLPQLSAPVPVLSCFGGLTMYRAIQWFDSRCRYYYSHLDGNGTNWLRRYASKNSQRPCEHVVFHNCLHNKTTLATDDKKKNNSSFSLSFSMAVQPAMRTEWNERISFGHTLRPGNRHDALGVFQKHADHADRLTNGKYTLRIHKTGTLRIERWSSSNATTRNNKQTPAETKWSASLQYAQDVHYWTHMYLILVPSGALQLIKQVPLSLLKKSNSTLCQSKKDPCVCSVDVDNCSIVVWSVNTNGTKENQTSTLSPVLVLDSHGHVSIVDENQHDDKVLWTSGIRA